MKRTAYEVLVNDGDIHLIQAYLEVSVVTGGALGDEYYLAIPQDDDLLTEIVDDLARQAAETDLPIAVYTVSHPHGPIPENEPECMCVQYEQDHRPRWSWNT